MENLEEMEATFLTEKDMEQIINSLSDDVIFDSLKEQIDNVFTSSDSTPTYYLTYFTTKYDYIMNKYSEYEEVISKVKDIREDFFVKVKTLIENKFDFSIEFPESMSSEKQLDAIGYLYDFFIIRNKKHSLNILVNYIEKEMKNLIRHYKPLIDKKDLSYTNLRKYINKDITVVICKLPDIIREMEVDTPQHLLELAVDDEWEITNNAVMSMFNTEQSATFGENFVSNIVNPIKGEEAYYLQARNYLMQSYNQK